MTARSRSLFRTNAHSNVNVGRHEKNNPTGGSTLAVYMLQGGKTAEDVTHQGVLWVKDHSAHNREGLASSVFILKNSPTRRDENVCPLNSVLY